MWRALHPDKKQFTWQRKISKDSYKKMRARLDYFLITRTLMTRVTAVEHKSGFKTDHSMVILTVKPTQQVRGCGFWKFNARLIENSNYVSGLKTVLAKTDEKHSQCNPQTKWEMYKCEAANFTRFFSKNLAISKREHLTFLNEKINFLSGLNEPHIAEGIEEELNNCKLELERILHQQVEKHAFFSKTKWYSYGERNSKFFSLAKSRYNNKTMNRLMIDNNIITDPDEILRQQALFYASLYRNNEKVVYNIKRRFKTIITDVQRDALDAPLTTSELRTALKHFAHGKTPGCDGFTIEFYETFWDQLELPYMDAINHGIENGKLHVSARRGVLTLIPKRNRNPLTLKSWRPITMLAMDNKLFSKVLDTCLKMVLDEIIQPYQTGFMTGRYILTNILKILEIMSDADAAKTKAIIMAIDFEKCFDMISFSAIQGALRYFGIGEKFIRYVMLLFDHFQLCTQNNGYISDWITPTRGLHQGCCISPHLFNCTRQVFTDIFENNNSIDAFTARGIRSLLAQFADDTNMFMKANEKTVCAMTQSLIYAEHNLGLKVNIEKTVMYRIGSLTGSNAQYYTRATYAWAEPPVQTLGKAVTTGTDMSRLNMIPVMEQIEDTLNHWA